MKDRWERMGQILTILHNEDCTVAEMRDKLILEGELLSFQAIDNLLRHYFKYSYLNREKDRTLERNPFRYRLSEFGMGQLAWIKSGESLKYITRYNERYNIQVL